MSLEKIGKTEVMNKVLRNPSHSHPRIRRRGNKVDMLSQPLYLFEKFFTRWPGVRLGSSHHRRIHDGLL